MLRLFWLASVAWLSKSIYAFSTSPYANLRHPTNFTLVDSLEVVPPSKGSEEWTVISSTKDFVFKFELKETWRTGGDGTDSLATKGISRILENDEWVHHGFSLMVITGDESNYHVRGSFEMSGVAYYLSVIPDVGPAIWTESDQESHEVDELKSLSSRNILEPDSSIDSSLAISSKTLLSSIGNTSGCPQAPHVASIGVIADMNFLKAFENYSMARSHIVDTVNQASYVWEQAFNISLALEDVVFADESYNADWNMACNVVVNGQTSLEARLNALASWRKKHRSRSMNRFALWSLFTECPSGSVVGIALQGTSCQPSGVLVIHHSILDYRVLAHETGHVFGAVHDCTSSTCSQFFGSGSDVNATEDGCCPFSRTTCDADGRFIMNPKVDLQQTAFSACTQGNVCGAIKNGDVKSTCLRSGSGSIASNDTMNLCSQDAGYGSYGQCLRDSQCAAATGQQSAYSCDENLRDGSCSMRCYTAASNRCAFQERDFEDGTPCGSREGYFCDSGRCVLTNRYKKSTLVEAIVIPVVVFVALCLAVIAFFLIRSRRASRRARNNENREGKDLGKEMPPVPPSHLNTGTSIEKGPITQDDRFNGNVGKKKPLPYPFILSYNTATEKE